MFIFQSTSSHWSTEHLSREFAAASTADLRATPPVVSMTERIGDSTGSNEPVRPFPLRSQQRQAPGRRDDVPQATVLIIDDEAPVRETLTEILDIHGYRFIAAGSVEEAEEVKQRLGVERIHLVQLVMIKYSNDHAARAGAAAITLATDFLDQVNGWAC